MRGSIEDVDRDHVLSGDEAVDDFNRMKALEIVDVPRRDPAIERYGTAIDAQFVDGVVDQK